MWLSRGRRAEPERLKINKVKEELQLSEEYMSATLGFSVICPIALSGQQDFP